MNISAHTKISELIRFNKASIEAIAGLNKNLEKLKNPVLRKILASRVTISDAARISGADISHLFNVLRPLGFEVTELDVKENANEQESTMNTEQVSVEPGTTVLDVRPILAENKDPFHAIMSSLSSLPEDNTLLLINSFEPTPLYKVLDCKGYVCSTKKADNVFYVSIRKKENVSGMKVAEQESLVDDFENVSRKFSDKLISVDVREMEMPKPMITILTAVDQLEEGYALHATHRKFPHLLIPELEERGFSLVHKMISDSEYHLLIYRK